MLDDAGKLARCVRAGGAAVSAGPRLPDGAARREGAFSLAPRRAAPGGRILEAWALLHALQGLVVRWGRAGAELGGCTARLPGRGFAAPFRLC